MISISNCRFYLFSLQIFKYAKLDLEILERASHSSPTFEFISQKRKNKGKIIENFETLNRIETKTKRWGQQKLTVPSNYLIEI